MTKPSRFNASGRQLAWLGLLFVLLVLLLVGIRLSFSGLQTQLTESSSNERARLFVGEEIIRSVRVIEKDLYRMSVSHNQSGLRRVNRLIQAQLGKLRHDLLVLKEGGIVQRQFWLNMEGRDQSVEEVQYTPPTGTSYVLEVIEILPLLDQLDTKLVELERLLAQSWAAQEREDKKGLLLAHEEISGYLKHIPPFFERIDENANRLFLSSNERLRELENELAQQSDQLQLYELTLFALVLLLSGLAGWMFIRRIQHANECLNTAFQDMSQAKEMAEQASRAKSEFVSRMSHELRTPLNAIIGFGELLESEPLTPSQENYVHLINGSGKHLLALINAVLDHAKIEAGGMVLERIAFNLVDTIHAAGAIVQEKVLSKGLNYEERIADAVPLMVEGDPTRLRQVLINLLVNAVKFTEQGSVGLEIQHEQGKFVFAVFDTGIGMDPTALDRLFKPFSQADESVTRRFGGTGLGLLISKELVELMGGQIRVESTQGAGSRFEFWLPLQAVEVIDAVEVTASPEVTLTPPQEMAITAKEEVAAEKAPWNPALLAGKVLLVDDNLINQKLASALLARMGVAFDLASNGQEAVDKSSAYSYALVLMDMEMPVMDGVGATRCIRAAEQASGATRLPIVAMTANAMEEDRRRCLDAGMDGFISKPISRLAMETEIMRVLNSFSS